MQNLSWPTLTPLLAAVLATFGWWVSTSIRQKHGTLSGDQEYKNTMKIHYVIETGFVNINFPKV